MKRKKKILFIIPSLARAGAQTQVVDLVSCLDADEFQKHLFTFESKLDQWERINQKDIHFYNYPRRYKFDFAMVRKIAEIIDKENIDLVHCTLQISLLMGWLGVRLAGRTPHIIVAIHTTLNHGRKEELLDRCLYRWFMRSCIKTVFVCNTQKDYWVKKYPFLNDKAQVIYNGIDVDYFSSENSLEQGIALRRSLNIDNSSSVVSCIAGFRLEKGHGILIEAFKRVRQERKDAFLLLAGDGETRKTIEKQVQSEGMSESIKFLGSVEDVRPALAASNLSVIASTAVETFSIAMLESMAMEVPLVATDIGGTREAVLHEETGLIVAPDNCEELAESILDMLNNNEKCKTMGASARKLVCERFTKSKMVSATAALFNAIDN